MMLRYFSPEHILKTVERRATVFLLTLVSLATAFWIGVGFWKYAHFLYQGLDLAIFSQVVWNTSQGRLFAMSIHPQSYLGDHFEPYILVLSVFYRLWSDPRLLLIIQAVIVNAAAIPLFFLARNVFQKTANITYPRSLALLVATAYLLNPFIGNALGFEFHILPFFLLPFFLAFLYAEQGRYALSMLALLAALIIREDVSFHVALFGVVVVLLFPACRAKKWRWILPPLLAAGAWFALSTVIVSHFSPTNDYKYIGFYSDLEGSLGATVLHLLTHPWPLLIRLIKPTHLITLGGLLMSVGYIALAAPTALLIGLIPLLQYALTVADSTQVLVLHYGVSFAPILFLGTIFGLQKLATAKWQGRLMAKLQWPERWPIQLGIIFLIAGTLYGNWSLNQVWSLDTTRREIGGGHATEQSIHDALKQVKNLSNLVVSKSFVSNLTNREHLYPLIYVRRGTQQLSSAPYVVPEPVDAMILEQQDVNYQVLSWEDGTAISTPLTFSSAQIQKIISENDLVPSWSRDGIAILRPRAGFGNPITLIAIEDTRLLHGTTIEDGLIVQTNVVQQSEIYELTMQWATKRKQKSALLHIESLDDHNNVVAKYRYDPGWGILPIEEWPTNATINTTFRMSRLPSATHLRLSLQPVDEQANIVPRVVRSLIVPL